MDKLKYFSKNQSGLTLIELIISIAIMGVVIALASTMIIQAFNLAPVGSRRMSAGQLAEMHITEISRYIRNARVNDKISISVAVDNVYDGEVTIGSDNEDYSEENFGQPSKLELTFYDQNNETITFYDITGFKMEYKDNDNNGRYSYEIELTKEVDNEAAAVKAIISPRNQ
ncbi:type II secretion system protein [Halarsenatibacter silvermanii]|uniref:Prepilin-type N-terminal cleavage/methylation domain-containing protein n=1 Tax=Halarsenatibacter silvermanii TaxID=321763 RepID=A0A1G9LCL7_9FIRM|nr:prepilin-type N-terminal cleavage/methylation domain-containing protein [Halarsenatibacter silvermanii]SDL59708.1 prepilin-type N-terminal cleavage/methylation domain-containing protein [Halarsenatibacter silvermanii]